MTTLQRRRFDRELATLFLSAGLAGSGKTTRSPELEGPCPAPTPDEWIVALFGGALHRDQGDAVRDPIEALQWQVAKRARSLGCDVVLDWGFWSRAERARYREEAEAAVSTLKVLFLDAAIDELCSRISRRVESTTGTLAISRSELEQWTSLFEPPAEDELP